ncbi:MAG: FAD-dependent oxidoreductase [Bernardetiaceae bacterium]|nr:FAD-dependent oxidoreductase [Bernardetiaceae bacterium]
MLSFWEKNSFQHYDYIIVGSGITGLSLAASLLEAQPKLRVLILEQGIFPSGASTKNAGFACFGSLSELWSDLQKMTENEVITLVNARYEGLKKLRKRLGDCAIGYEKHGGYELISEKEEPLMAHRQQLNDLLAPYFKKPVFNDATPQIKNFGFNPDKIKRLVLNPYEAQIDTGAMMQALTLYVMKKGVEIRTGTKVSTFQQNGNKVWIETESLHQKIALSATKIAICTNGFTHEMLPKLDVEPGRGQVLITKPIPNLPIKGTFHMDEGFYYFRNYQDRILLGGGRNVDFEAERTTAMQLNDKIINDLKQKLQTWIMPKQAFEIDMQWVGIMAFGENKKFLLEMTSERVLIAVRLSGMGIALGSHIAAQGAKMLMQA